MKRKKARLIVALDVETSEEALSLVDSLSSEVDIFKVGSQLFTACGPQVVRSILAKGKKVFLDLKFYDIPHTVACSTSTATVISQPLNKGLTEGYSHVFMLTLHARGKEMLAAAAQAASDKARELNVERPLLVGVTVLTSETKSDSMQDTVLKRARCAKESGLDGVVASAQEASMIRREMGDDFIIVTPGIRPKGAEVGDQKRITTPQEAIQNGSDFLVVGRPIIRAKDPQQAAQQILKEMEDAIQSL